ncbi:DUF3352 domain-containing protein [Microbispora sp. CA-135349]|uniref:DUF3352 domain-containing protein n=1 Tax=Microbispora sp. CA-135349 TaxID=3239953 RepID=UPI003D8CDBEA
MEPDIQRPERRRRRWPRFVLIAVVASAAVAAGVYATALLSGAGTQPQDVLPAGALGYVRVDFDPAASQKMAFLRVAGKFAAAKRQGGDPRAALLKALGADARGVDFDRDVMPWLGDRMGMALLPSNGTTEPSRVLAIQVTDEAAARTGIGKVGKPWAKGIAFLDDYAIVAETQPQAEAAVAQARKRPLTEDDAFKADMAALGEPGVLSFWGYAGKLMRSVAEPATSGAGAAYAVKAFDDSRVAGALRFTGDHAEITGLTRGIPGSPMRPGPVHIEELPASTALAVSFSGLDEVVTGAWPDARAVLDRQDPAGPDRRLVAELRRYGIDLPDDLVALVGGNLTFAMEYDRRGGVRAGIVKRSYSPKAEEVRLELRRLYADRGIPFGSGHVDDGIVLASSQEYSNKLGQRRGLAKDPAFQEALPGLATATYACYLDLDRLEKRYLPYVDQSIRRDVARFRAIGLSGRTGEQGGTFTVRLLLN